MLAVKSMDVRDNFKSLCDKVFNGETLIISRPKNENIVMLSEAEYNEMMKAKRNAEYLAMLDKSMAEAEAGGRIGGIRINEYSINSYCLGAIHRMAEGR